MTASRTWRRAVMKVVPFLPSPRPHAGRGNDAGRGEPQRIRGATTRGGGEDPDCVSDVDGGTCRRKRRKMSRIIGSRGTCLRRPEGCRGFACSTSHTNSSRCRFCTQACAATDPASIPAIVSCIHSGQQPGVQ